MYCLFPNDLKVSFYCLIHWSALISSLDKAIWGLGAAQLLHVSTELAEHLGPLFRALSSEQSEQELLVRVNGRITAL